jgi:hypothetical protein
VDGAHEIHLQARWPCAGIGAHRQGGRVVDEDIDATERLPCIVEERAEECRVGHVTDGGIDCRACCADLGLSVAQGCLVPPADGYGATLGRESARNRQADATGAAEHDSAPPFQSQIHPQHGTTTLARRTGFKGQGLPIRVMRTER